MQPIEARLAGVTWLDTLLSRRSSRFALGMKMPAGPLAYTSAYKPHPLTEDENAALAFAAAGITGPALADLCFERGQGGSIMNGFVGRCAGSGDCIQAVSVFLINDDGTWLLKRPRDLDGTELRELIRLGQERAFREVYRKSRVRIKEHRASPPLDPLFNINCNRWSAYAPGTTYLLPVNDLTFLYINGLLEIFNESTNAFILDERAGFRPAGVARFARSRGGHLDDNPSAGKIATIELVERFVTEFVCIEQGMILQNLGLMANALGLGGFTNFANHEFGWFQALGFTMNDMPASQYLGAGKVISLAMKVLGRDQPVPFPIGLDVDGHTWLKAWCPPYFQSMRQAVEAVVEAKVGALAVGPTAWAEAKKVEQGFPRISSAAIDATVAYCEYVWHRYGRFPAYLAPFRTVTGFQACHLDQEFYDKFYQPEALTSRHREDFKRTKAAVLCESR